VDMHVCVGGLKVVNRVPRRGTSYSLLRALAVGCNVQPQLHSVTATDRQTDVRETDDSMMPIADHTA